MGGGSNGEKRFKIICSFGLIFLNFVPKYHKQIKHIVKIKHKRIHWNKCITKLSSEKCEKCESVETNL